MAPESNLRVVVAGGGIAAVEALLALHDLAEGRVSTTLLCPAADFVCPPLAVAEPFGSAEPRRIPLDRVAADTGASLWPDALAGVDEATSRLHTIGGDSLPFDLALIAVGAKRINGLPGSLAYRGGIDNAAFTELLRDAERGRLARLAFVVPASVRWPLAIYDLALLTASHLRQSGSRTRISLVTHEPTPLSVFGGRASSALASALAEARIDLRASREAIAVRPGALALEGGGTIAADRVVSLPRVQVPGLTGIPQSPRGFISTDPLMRVEGRSTVYAAGDATWFPIKHGGLAAQQADVAAAAIAARGGAEVKPEPFQPVLRAAILTGSGPLFLRSELRAPPRDSSFSKEPLWWPPNKVAGRYLAGYLRHGGSGPASNPLEDLDEAARSRTSGAPASLHGADDRPLSLPDSDGEL